jgi:hypothetical protein
VDAPIRSRARLALALSLHAVLFSILSVQSASAQTFPSYINYQGKLGDASGNPLTGTYSFRFRLYAQSSGGSALFTDANFNAASAVSVTNGLYSVQIGSLTAGGIPDAVFHQAEIWLEVDVSVGADYTGSETLAPRERMTTAPFAFRANNAHKLGTGVSIATFTAQGLMTFPYEVKAGSMTLTSGLTASSGTFSASGPTQYSIVTSSGINLLAGGVRWADGTLSTTASGGSAGSDPTKVDRNAPDQVNLSTVTTALDLKANLGGATFTGASGITNAAFTATGPLGYIVSASSINASGFFGSGTGLTGVTAATNANLTGNVTSVGNATTLATIPAISGANLTSLTAANVAAGAFPSNVAINPAGVDLSTVTTALNLKAPLASPTFTGNVTFPGSGQWTSAGNIQLVSGSTITTNGTVSISTAASAALTGTPALFINQSGDVGVGTATPGYKMEVGGTFGGRFDSTNTGALKVGYTASAPAGYYSTYAP